MFKTVQRELLRGRYCFNTTVIARLLRDNVDVTATNSLWIRNFSTHLSKMVKARKYVLVKHFVNEPKPTDLKLVEEELPPLKNGGRKNH